MANQESSTLVGCLLDVSGSMRKVLEAGRSDERATDRFHAVLEAALNIARREQQNDAKTKMFVGAFGLDRQAGYPPTVDLCGKIEALSRDANQNNSSGHELLIEIANERNLAHITEYIRTKLTDSEARIVYACLQRRPERISEFIDALPSACLARNLQEMEDQAVLDGGTFLAAGGSMVGGSWGRMIGAALGRGAAKAGSDKLKDLAVDSSKGLQLARSICREWFQDFIDFVPRPVGDVVQLLQELQRHPTGESMCLSDTIGQFMYGDTPLCDALSRCLSAFCAPHDLSRQVLVLMSDGHGTDGDPGPIASKLHSQGIFVAGVYLTSDHDTPQRRLYDRPPNPRDKGKCTLFNIASKVSASTHPVPVTMSVGWQAPCSGEVALYVSVCTETAV